MIDMMSQIYAGLFTEGDFTLDEQGALKVSKVIFLHNLDAKKLEEKQKSVLQKAIERMAHHFSNTVMKKARRFSISVKRPKPAEFDSLTVNDSQWLHKYSEGYLSAEEE